MPAVLLFVAYGVALRLSLPIGVLMGPAFAAASPRFIFDDAAALMGVLAHELDRLRERHQMRRVSIARLRAAAQPAIGKRVRAWYDRCTIASPTWRARG